MYIPATAIIVLSCIAISAVTGVLWALAAEKIVRAIARREYAKQDAERKEDLRDLIARAEAKGVDIPESIRSAVA